MVIMHNMPAANAARQAATGEKQTAKSAERLGSGYRINRAGDDAAGLSISEKMRWQIRGLGRASDNSKDGISYIQTAEGALQEIHSIMDRCKELCVQAANDTNTEQDREAVQEEIDQLSKEIDRIASTTQYNTMNVFSTDGISPYARMATAPQLNMITVEYEFINEDGDKISVDSGNENAVTNYTGDQKTIADYVAREASKAAQAILSAYPALLSASSNDVKVGLKLAAMDGSGGTLASASLSMSWSSAQTSMTYTLNVDTSDYDITNYNDGGLSATLAHEMTHLIMQDTLTSGMLGRNSEPYPLWFVEGMAQTASGDDGWLSGQLNAGSTDAQIQNYLAQTSSMPYGAGYLSTLYLAQMAAGATTVGTSSLQSGVNYILGELIEGNTLSQVINKVSGGAYADYKDFQKNVSKDTAAVQFTKDFIAARGATGAGSVIAADLSTETTDLLNGRSGYTNSYTIVSTTSSYTNIFASGFTFPDKGTATGVGGGGSGTGGSTYGGDGLKLQVGSLGGQMVALNTYDVSTGTLFKGKNITVLTHAEASDSITIVDETIEAISKIRSYYGAMQNRLEHVVANLDNTEENTQAAESRIRDADAAEEMVSYSASNIITQASQSMLAQANRGTDSVLRLLEM